MPGELQAIWFTRGSINFSILVGETTATSFTLGVGLGEIWSYGVSAVDRATLATSPGKRRRRRAGCWPSRRIRCYLRARVWWSWN